MDDKVPFAMGLQPAGPKARIADERIRAQIEGPFTAIYVSIADAVRMEEAAQSIGLFAVRYQFNYICLSQNGDAGAFDGLVDELARQNNIRAELVVAGAENVVEALIACFEHLKKRDAERARQINKPGSAPAPQAQTEGGYPEL